MHTVHTFSPYFRKIHSNVILPSTPSSSECFLPVRSSDQHFVRISHAFYMSRSSILRGFIILVICGEV